MGKAIENAADIIYLAGLAVVSIILLPMIFLGGILISYGTRRG